MAVGNLFGSGGESNSLYGTSLSNGGAIPAASSFIYFEWFIFKVSASQPATPTGGSWDFLTNTGTPPTGWASTEAGIPLDNLWFSIAFVDSRNPTNVIWSEPGLISAATSVYATAYADTFTGTGSTTVWTLTADPVVVANLDVSINGVTQTPTVDYTVTGTTFTTTTAAPLGSILLVKYRQALPNSYFGLANNVGYTPHNWIAATNVQAALNEVADDISAVDGVSGSNLVGYLPAGTGAVATNVQDKLRQTVSVMDFGAVGDNATDDTAAIQAAIDYLKGTSRGGTLLLPAGTYRVTSINASNFGNLFNKNLRIVGEGMFASRLIGQQDGAIVLDCIGSNNIELEEFFIGTSGSLPQAGLLLARSATSNNCNGSRIKNLSIEGSFSIACCVAIAAESSVWYAPRFHNTYAPANYTGFITANRNNVGIVSTNGVPQASSNTDNTMFKPTFYAPYGSSTIAVRFQGSAGYDIYSGFVVSGNTAGGILCQYEVDPGTGIFRGDVVWHDPLLEGKSPKIHYLVGDAGTTDQYFYGIKQKSGYVNHYDTTAFDLMIGNPTSTKYNLFNSEISEPRYNPSTTPTVTLYVASASILRLRQTATGASVLNISAYTSVYGGSDITAATWNVAQNISAPIQSFGSAAPTSGTYPKNFIVWNNAPAAGGTIGWVCTTAGAGTLAITGVAITGTAGQFSCTASTLVVGQQIVISGTLGGTGTITGYTNPKTYLIGATNGTTTFTLTTLTGGAIVTTAGTPTGLTYVLAVPIWKTFGTISA